MAVDTLQQHFPTARANQIATAEMVFAALSFATMSCVAHGFRDLVSWPVIAFARISVTLAMVLCLMYVQGAPLVIAGSRALWWRSLSGSVGILCIFYCLTRLPITDTVTILATSPLWVTVILAIVFRQRVPLRAWCFVALAIAGVFLMHRPQFNAESFPLVVVFFGAIVVAVVKISLSFCREYHPTSVVAHYATCSTLCSLTVCLLLGDDVLLQGDMNPWLWLWLLPMGLAGTFGQVFMTRAYGRGTTTLIALVGIIQIIFAAFYDLVIWGHTFDLPKVLGIFMIAAAIALSILTQERKVVPETNAAA